MHVKQNDGNCRRPGSDKNGGKGLRTLYILVLRYLPTSANLILLHLRLCAFAFLSCVWKTIPSLHVCEHQLYAPVMIMVSSLGKALVTT